MGAEDDPLPEDIEERCGFGQGCLIDSISHLWRNCWRFRLQHNNHDYLRLIIQLRYPCLRLQNEKIPYKNVVDFRHSLCVSSEHAESTVEINYSSFINSMLLLVNY